MLSGKDRVHLGRRVQPLQTTPELLGSGKAVSFSPKMASHYGNHEDSPAEGGRRVGNKGCLVRIAAERLPLDVLEEHGSGCIGSLPAEHREVVDALRDHHVHPDACLETAGRLELAVPDAASTFQHTVVDLDALSPRIPFHPLLGIVESGHRRRGEKHPLDLLIAGINGPYRHGGRGIAVRGTQGHVGEPDIEQGIPGGLGTSAGNVYLERTRSVLLCHDIPEETLVYLAVTRLLRADEERGTGLSCGLEKELVDIRLPIPYAHEHGLGTKLLEMGRLPEALKPLHALLLLDGQFLASTLLSFFVPCPALGIDDAKGRAVLGEGEGVVEKETDGIILLVVDRPQPLGPGVGIGEACRILGQEHDAGYFLIRSMVASLWAARITSMAILSFSKNR